MAKAVDVSGSEPKICDEDAASSTESIASGMEPIAKQLYRPDRYTAWSEWSPYTEDLDADEPSENKKFALIVRREKETDGSEMVLHSITIQSPYIRAVLSEVFREFRGVYPTLKDLTFRRPFHEFFYRWGRLQDEISTMDDETAKVHIDLLLDVITPEIKPHLEIQKDLIAHGLITFDYLWAIFEPDIEIYATSRDYDRFYLSRGCYYEEYNNGTYFFAECKFIDYDGEDLGWAYEDIRFSSFKGHKRISELQTLPSKFAANQDSVKTRLSSRGKAFEKLVGMHYRQYSGLYMPDGAFSPDKANMENGRIVVDPGLYYELHPSSRPSLRLFPSDSDGEANETNSDGVGGSGISDDSAAETSMGEQSQLTSDEYHLCSPFVWGFCLKLKEWARFVVSNIAEIQWDKQAFARLVLPSDYKELMLAFTESQLSHQDQFDDIISGKGQGIIMLLSGDPGVGKTLTAESIAEEMKRPLYAMSAGELGYDARSVESNLRSVLDISTKWDAVLLIDECDVFLEQRTTSDLERNKLVSVFLRLLEYFKGVMFLTTNRVSTFDAAFKSRIHLTITYPPLNYASRRTIWCTFAKSKAEVSVGYDSELSEEDLDELAKLDFNGREIKNIVKTARLLAKRKRSQLSMPHVQTVLRIKRDEMSVGM